MLSTLNFKDKKVIKEPNLVYKLLNDPRAAFLWLPIRIWLGWQWIDAARGKLDDPAWTDGGVALKGFWERIVQVPETGRPPIAYDWYRDFIQMMLDAEAYTWFSKVVMFGELFIGIALILGAFTAIAAFAGGFMNWNFMMAGSASTNPMLFVAAIGLILSWKVCGLLGADYVLLNWLGTPWGRSKTEAVPAQPALPPQPLAEAFPES